MIIDKTIFKDVKQLHKFIFENKKSIIATKRANLKEARSVIIDSFPFEKTEANKGFGLLELKEDTSDVLHRRAVINTTNIFDSHKDLHLPKMWNKSLKETINRSHKREHQSGFANIISDGDDLKAFVLDTTFKSLGFNLKGATQALVYDSTIRKVRNEFMFNQYANGWVKEHSVGMIYVKMDVAINNKDYPEEFDNYKKYIEMGANPEAIEKDGYFFPIFEAIEKEGSAVTEGSNYVTPILPLKEYKNIEQLNGTHTEQPEGTQKVSRRKLLIT